MVKKISWTSQAKEDYRDIISYLLDKWSFDIADKFTTHVDEILDLLKLHNDLGMALDRLTSLRKIAIQPHFTLFYSNTEDKILILNILDNRSRPQIV